MTLDTLARIVIGAAGILALCGIGFTVRDHWRVVRNIWEHDREEF